MRYRLPIVLAMLGAQAAAANGPAGIEWNAARPLTWEDFQGAVPRGADPERVATTAASIGWSYRYAMEWSGRRCRFVIRSIDSAALFHPEDSWVRPEHRTDAILRHEQGHFDIARVFEARFAAATRELVDAPRECDGRSERRAARSAEQAIAALVGSLFDEIWQDYRRRQEAYDSETRHGIDREAQARWTERIAASLAAAGTR